MLDNDYASVYLTYMNKNTPAEWTDKQRAAYELLMSRVQAPRTISFGKAPKDGWKDSDKVPTK